MSMSMSLYHGYRYRYIHIYWKPLLVKKLYGTWMEEEKEFPLAFFLLVLAAMFGWDEKHADENRNFVMRKLERSEYFLDFLNLQELVTHFHSNVIVVILRNKCRTTVL